MKGFISRSAVAALVEALVWLTPSGSTWGAAATNTLVIDLPAALQLAGARSLDLTAREDELAPLTLVLTNSSLDAVLVQAFSTRPGLAQNSHLVGAAREARKGAVRLHRHTPPWVVRATDRHSPCVRKPLAGTT